MARITGFGGVFFKCADPKALAEWYRDILGIEIEDWGGALLKRDPDGPPHVVWAPFSSDTKYFQPSTRELMINFAVDDLDDFVGALTGKGVEVLGRDDNESMGKFAWFMDPAGTKIELWEPRRP
ncbi:MAG: VOC family protein [Rhizomicrobium sp.]|jgi:catechol 2,3-dioxygenase-like lactoylglutathione lyase family enzyme